MTTGEKLQALRTVKGWSQDDLAKKLGTKAPEHQPLGRRTASSPRRRP